MNDKKKYYKLDDIGFIGVQDKKYDKQRKKDIEQTTQYIKDLQAARAGANKIPGKK